MSDIIIIPDSGTINFIPSSTIVSKIEGSGNNLNISNSSGNINISGNFFVNNNRVSYSGHSHNTSDINNFNNTVSELIPIQTINSGSGISIVSSGTDRTIGITNHNHSTSDIINFNTTVSGLIPIQNITNGSGINIESSGTNRTISIGSHSHSASDITNLSGIINNSLPSTIVYTTGAQSITGVKLFTDGMGIGPIDNSQILNKGLYIIASDTKGALPSLRIFSSGGVTRVLDVRNNNNINIGNITTFPLHKLNIRGDSTDSTSAALNVINSGNNSILFARNDQRVGIGTNSPSGQLHVIGSGIFTSGIFVNNNPVSVSGHSHASSDISDFNSSVSGLINVQDISAGSGIDISNSGGIYTISSAAVGSVRRVNSYSVDHLITKHPHGFVNISDSNISFDRESKTLSLSPAESEYDIYILGNKITKTGTYDITLSYGNGPYFISFNLENDLTYNMSNFDYINEIPVSFVYYNNETDTVFFTDERLAASTDPNSINYINSTIGLAYYSGLSLTNYNAQGDGSLYSHATIGIENGTILDRNKSINIIHSDTPTNLYEQKLSPVAHIPVLYRRSPNYWYSNKNSFNNEFNSPLPYKNAGSGPQYNQKSIDSDIWTISNIPNNTFVSYWICATNNLIRPIVSIMGQRYDTSLNSAISLNKWEDLKLDGIPFDAIKPIYRLIYQTNLAYTNNAGARLVSVSDLRHINHNFSKNDHNALYNLNNNDDHSQYVHLSNPRNISAIHTFNNGIISDTILPKNINNQNLHIGADKANIDLLNQDISINSERIISLNYHSDYDYGRILFHDVDTNIDIMAISGDIVDINRLNVRGTVNVHDILTIDGDNQIIIKSPDNNYILNTDEGGRGTLNKSDIGGPDGCKINNTTIGEYVPSFGYFTELKVGGIDVSVSGHTHMSNDISDFASTVSGLLPVKDLVSGSGISIGSTSGVYTISAFGVAASSASSLITRADNKTGSTISKMSVVYINGGHGNRPTIQKSIASSESTSSKTYGVTASDINNNHTGDIIVVGALIDVDTNQFGASEGSTLYLSPSISGGITSTKPLAPNHLVTIGKIVRNHSTQGIIEVSIQNGFELYELHDVAVTGATSGQFLQYNSSGLWVPSSSGNFTSLSVNGTGVISSSGGTTNYISKFTSSSTIGNSLIFDNGTNVGIGTATPQSKVHITDTNDLNTTIEYTNATVGFTSGVRPLKLLLTASNGVAVGAGVGIDFVTKSSSTEYTGARIISNRTDTSNNHALTFWAGGGTTSLSEYMRISSNGNVGIGISSPSHKLHVSGVIRSTSHITSDTEFRLNNAPFSRVATMDSAGSFAGGYNIYLSGSTPKHNSAGALSSYYYSSDGSVRFYTNSSQSADTNASERLRITSNGNVGIGTTTPSGQLHVIGTGLFSSALLVNNNIVWHSGNFNSSNIVRTTGTQTIGPNKTFSLNSHNDALIIGNSSLGFRDGSGDSDFNDLAGGELNLELTTNNGFGTKFFVGSGSVGVSNVVDGGSSGPYRDRLFFDVASSTSYPGGKTTLTTSPVTNNITITLPNTGGTLALLANINTSQITGVLPVNKGGTNITSYSNGQLLIGSGTSLVANTLSAGTGIAITNGSGTITINTSGLQTLLTNPVTGTGTGASTSGYLPRWNSTSGLNNSDIYQSGSNIGIGTVTPSGKLHVSGTIIASGGNSTNWNTAYGWGNHAVEGYITNYILNGITIFGNDGSNQNIVFENDGAPVADITWDDTNDRLQINALQVNITAENGLIVETDNPIQFNPNGGGNVGIGIVNPTSKLHVAGDILATGSFIGGSGTAALPSFEFVNDPDTGLFSPAANTLAISTSGVERLLVDNAGNVGIGNSYPNSKLDVIGTFACGTPGGDPYAGGQGLYLDPSVPSLTFNDISGPNTTLTINNDGLTLYDFVGSPFFYTDRNNARIGIGTATPYSKLQVNGSLSIAVDGQDVANGNEGIIFGTDGSISSNDSGPGPLFSVDAINGLRTYGDGGAGSAVILSTDRSNLRVGIGTDTPDSTLHVVGDVNIDGNLIFDSYTESVVANGNSGANKTLSLASGTVHTCTLTNNCTFTMPTATAGKSFSMFLNSGSGNYTASFSGVRWADSAIPTATITASKVDIYSFISDGTFWYGSFSQNYG